MQAERTAVLRYRGISKTGTAIMGVGRAGESPADLAKRLFDQRVRRAVITRDGLEVGGVGSSPRTWWGEHGAA